jgi:membrane fusion protein (multidrug efflux system)
MDDTVAWRHCVLAAGLVLVLATASALHAQERPRVGVVAAERAEMVEELSLTGTITSPRRARLSPEVEGRVSAIAVDAGDRVTAGQTLLMLDDEIARLELAQARAAKEEAVAELGDARRRLREVRDLARRKSIADSQVHSVEAEVRRDSAVVERREAERSHQAALLKRHILKAPFDGVIAQRLTDLGEWVEPGTRVLELVAVDRLRFDFQVPQSYFGRIGPHTTVSLRLDALPRKLREAQITEIVPVSDPSARTFLARVGLDNAEGRMTPGMSGRATLRIGTGEKGVVVPRDALIRYPDGRITIWVASANGRSIQVNERRVQTGLAFGGRVQIVGGLDAGTQVVVRGNETLQEGQEVSIESDG